jgi:serine/threonine-protein kinase
VAVGDVIAGKYRIEGVIGEGGMGIVLAARHLELDQLVAIKFVHPSQAHEQELIQRFFREARAAAAIKSPHVVRVLDVSRLESGAPYMVMEHLEGTDLEFLLHDRGPLPPADAVDYVLQACDAIAEAHAAGLVHRDLKPGNLFLAEMPDGSRLIKVLDFGISKVMDAPIALTRGVMGTLIYMPPEQLRSSRDVDSRADIWALGVILYELLWGPLAEGDAATAAMVMKERPPPLRDRRPELDAGLDLVVLRCLERDLDRRFQDVRSLVEALRPWAPRNVDALLTRFDRLVAVRTSGFHGAIQKSIGVPPRAPDTGNAETEPLADGSAYRAALASAPTHAAPTPPEASESSAGTVGPWTPRGAQSATGANRRSLIWGGVALGVTMGTVGLMTARTAHRAEPGAGASTQAAPTHGPAAVAPLETPRAPAVDQGSQRAKKDDSAAPASPTPSAASASAARQKFGQKLGAVPVSPTGGGPAKPWILDAPAPASASAHSRGWALDGPAPASTVPPSPPGAKASAKKNPLDVTIE